MSNTITLGAKQEQMLQAKQNQIIFIQAGDLSLSYSLWFEHGAMSNMRNHLHEGEVFQVPRDMWLYLRSTRGACFSLQICEATERSRWPIRLAQNTWAIVEALRKKASTATRTFSG